MAIKDVLDFEGLSHFTEKMKSFVTAITSKLETNKLDKTTVATSSTLGLVKSGTDITVDTSGNVSVKDNSHKHTVSNISDLTATASELNVLDGITASTAELNYTDGVTSNIQTQLNAKAPLASPTLTGTPKAPTATAGTNSTQIATTAFVTTAVANGIAASDAMIIKGTIGTSGTVTSLPTTYKTGWTYRVVTAGTYAGQVCEIGDLIVALVDRSGSGNVDSDWCVAQTNINGAITGIKSGDAYISTSQSGSVVTITHKNVTRTNTTSTASPSHGGTFTAVKTVTSDAKGHVTGVDTETVTLPTYTALKNPNAISINGKSYDGSSAVNVGTIGAAYGGTGKTSLNDSANVLINSLSTGDDTPSDADYYVAQYAGGGTTTTTYHRRPISALWNYIKSKLATVATSGSYNDLSNKPTIGNGTVTIKQAGTSKGTFTMNQSGNTTIELTDNNTTYGVVSTSADGLAPKRDGSTTKYLRADGTWAVPPDTNTTYKSLKNPYALTIQGNGTTLTNGTYDGSAAKTVNITPSSIGAATSGHTHSSYVNQNAFSNVTVGSATISADTTTDTLTLAAGSNVTITPDATNDKITISSSHPTISKSTNTTSTASPSAGGTFTAIDSITQDSNGHVTKFNTKTVTLPSTSITVDSALSSTSTNPVQNKVINSALSGKANSSHGTHVTYSTTAPVMDGTASVGTATTVARSDHRHPTDTSRASTSSVLSTVAQCTASTTSSNIAGASALAELNNSLTKTPEYNVITLDAYNMRVRYRKILNIVELDIESTDYSLPINSDITLCTLPEGYRPKDRSFPFPEGYNSKSTSNSHFFLGTNGALILQNLGTSETRNPAGHCVYLV